MTVNTTGNNCGIILISRQAN